MTTFIFSLALKQSQDEAKIFPAGRNVYGGIIFIRSVLYSQSSQYWFIGLCNIYLIV